MKIASLAEPFQALAGSPADFYVVIEDFVDPGGPWRAQLKSRSSDATPVTAFTVVAQEGTGIELPEEPGGDPVDQAGNLVLTLTLTGAKTRALINSGGGRSIVSHLFDIERVPAVGDPVTYLKGTLVTTQDISRD